ncbi:1,4-alpha-glucan branching enzyme [Desulfocicer vacuolatum DSM 3385]|uniref:1,4-alpha-glucan branching enzyme n=1 Tax=Desulfocicer vacuolatum DSM 3385 TaxID=1121400 RepID=A0A1W2DVE8_9BACT|nr:1,4-alpha-glucan branching enzyme [Desulfocicer vacuolatum DSM 3385]
MSDPGIFNDPGLLHHQKTIQARLDRARVMEQEITDQGRKNIYDVADYHLFFGLHFTGNAWCFREWAPHATAIYIIGDMTRWQLDERFCLVSRDSNGIWEGWFDTDTFCHGQHYRLRVLWPGGEGDRIPTAALRVVQDSHTLIFNAQVWQPWNTYAWKNSSFIPSDEPLLIYEAHVGMAQEEGRVGTYREFEDHILPRVADAGYNTLQLMAVQEHPYYGSFGYHVSSFFAPSSRFGTPEELKSLVDAAHGLGIRVIMDLIHSHAVKNEVEGLGAFDGTSHQFFHKGQRGIHKLWDSRCFDYDKNQVIKFLLSNCRYWLEKFKMDGFRFDGVTSMLFLDHGIGRAFTSYADYYRKGEVDGAALGYLFLANRIIHDISPRAITIAEEVSGYPGIAAPQALGGTGFDYRFAMGVPDYWIRLLKEFKDELWPLGSLWYELNARREDEKSISYAESHDQALVGDQTLFMRLMGENIYHGMWGTRPDIKTLRALSLHKMIRLITLATAGDGYLNFMGNEFGHPEWIDFPGAHNQWSYHYARRQWSLRDNPDLYFSRLADFDRAMINGLKSFNIPGDGRAQLCYHHEDHKMIAFFRGKLLFVFNFHTDSSYTNYLIPVPPGRYGMLLDTDEKAFGGQGRLSRGQVHFTTPSTVPGDIDNHFLSLYLPTRTAVVLLSSH